MPRDSTNRLSASAGPWVDLALTLPIFLGYHIGVVFLDVRNASDLVTGELLLLAEGNRTTYLLTTACMGVVFAGVLAWLGRGRAFSAAKFIQIGIEGVIYAALLRVAGGYVVAHVFAGKIVLNGLSGLVMSMGAGFYEELTYRVLLFGGLGRLLGRMANVKRSRLLAVALGALWALVCAAIFSAAHYVGPLGDPFSPESFVFRWALGVVLTLIFWSRGFAAAVWAHTFYDAWLLVF